ncbi:DUF4158 domain-containing protein (plasmid) [Brevibacillus laterosporus]|nr:DUF4158 domain-containing protein [Brevibacillus laterosporus]
MLLQKLFLQKWYPFRFRSIAEDDWVLGTYYTFSKRDLEIINKRRREENRLGFAVQ